MNLPTIIICVILVIIICIGIRSTKKRATSGCCGSSETIKKVRVKDKNEENTLKAFPMLATSPFGAEASKCIFWSEEHDSIGVVCHDEDGVGRYTKVREKYEWDKTTTPWTLTNERVKGSKWIKT